MIKGDRKPWNPPNLAHVGMSVMDGILKRMFCVSKEMFEMVFDARTQSNNCFFVVKLTCNRISITVRA